MTTIFAFKARNMWVLVADRFATERASLTNEQFEGRPYRTLLVDIDQKIFNKDRLVFSGCGDQDTITRATIEISKNCSNLDECKRYINTHLENSWFKSPEGYEVHLDDRPLLLIISKLEQEAILVNFRTENDDKIKHVDSPFFLGGGGASLNKSLVKQEIVRFFHNEVSDSADIAIQSAKWLDLLWLGLHKDLLKLTGPPSFIGCDVCIIKKDGCRTINVQPKNYEIV